MNPLEYETTLKDLIQFNWYHTRKSKAAFKFRMFFLLFLLVLEGVLFRNPVLLLSTSFIYCFFMYLVSPLFIPVQAFLTYKRKQSRQMLGKMRLSFSEEGVVEKTEVSENKFFWKSILSIAENSVHIYLNNSPLSAIIIPKRVFSNKMQKDEFLRTIKELWEANRERSAF